jgi:hypothetical protein
MYTDSQIIEIRQREEKIKRFTEFINKMPLEFQTSLNQLNQGQKNGWRSKTAAEAAADDVLIQTLVKAFQ